MEEGGLRDALAAVGLKGGSPFGFADEMRVGLRGTVRRVWGRRGAKVRRLLQIAYEGRYLFLAMDSQAGRFYCCWLDALTAIDIRSAIRGLRPFGLMAPVWDRAAAHRDQGVRSLGLPLVEQPPASPELNPAGRVFEELRRAVEGKVYATLEDKVEAVGGELTKIEADPDRVRRLTGWDWITAAKIWRQKARDRLWRAGGLRRLPARTPRDRLERILGPALGRCPRMSKRSKRARERKWFDSAHASLCVLGSYLRLVGFFQPLEQRLNLKQKAGRYTPVQKVEMFFVALLAGAQAVYHTATTLRVDRALQLAFGLPGCAEQSVIAATLDAATEADVVALRQAVEESFRRYGQACRHDFRQGVLVLDLDLSPLPTSAKAEGAERGYMGRCRSKTGRKLARVRAAATQEILFEEVLSGRSVETLAVVRMVVEAAERLLGLDGDTPEARAKRARTEWRLNGGWGTEEIIAWLLARGYQVTGKFKSPARVKKLVRGIAAWEATASPGREVAAIPTPVAFERPLRQYAVRTPSQEKEHADDYYYAVLFTSRQDLDMTAVVAHYDNRAGMEADLKSDKHGLGLAVVRKHKLAAQKVVVLLVELAHNVLIWARTWLAKRAPRLRPFGIVRLVREVWAVPGRVKLAEDRLKRLRLNPEHPRARDVAQGLRELLGEGQTVGIWV